MNAILTCSQHFIPLALNEIRRQHPSVQYLKRLSAHHHIIRFNGSFDALTRPWRHKLPIYIHHLFPLQSQIRLTQSLADVHLIHTHIAKRYSGNYALQIRIVDETPYTMQDIAPDCEPQGQVISLLIANGRAYMGLSYASQNISPWISGRPYYYERTPNRAGLKLLEALNTFNINLREGDHALDLGAAPGAWTEMLRRRGLYVTAVAPTPMYDWLEADEGVRIYRTTAEDYLPQCDTKYDLIVNDMKMDGRDSARLMVEYAEHLRGIAIMTVKLRLKDAPRIMDHTFRLLRKRYKIIRVRQMVSNRKEVTLFLIPLQHI